MKKRIVVLGTGGTISGRATSASDNLGYNVGEVGIESLLEGIPSKQRSAFEIAGEQLAQLDSKDMSFTVLRVLAQRVEILLASTDVVGIVITHGTDTLEETAFFLQQVCNPLKPVVLTCAMRPATSYFPDGPQNLLDALAVVSCADAAGVFVVCAGRIHNAQLVQKIHSYRLDAFSSVDTGCCGFIEEGRVRFVSVLAGTQANTIATTVKQVVFPIDENAWPRVEILMNFVGASGLAVDALVAHGVDGIVVAGTGNGTIHHSLEIALLRAQSQGIAVVVATRCAEGRVLQVAGRQFEGSDGLSPVKARIDLVLKLLNNKRVNASEN
jgi:L-asparaginase